MFTRGRFEVDHWIGSHLVRRHELFQRWAMRRLVRAAHWLGYHHLAFYAPDDDAVEGITFGTEQYVNEVIDAHEQVFGDDQEGRDALLDALSLDPDLDPDDVDPEPPDAA